MKKRLIAVMFAAIMAIGCVFGLAACKDDEESVAGTYIMYAAEGTVAMSGGELTLKDGKATLTMGSEGAENGTYSVKDGKITVTIDGDPQTFAKKDNYWYVDEEGMRLMICKKGETPKGYTVEEM